MTQTVQLRPPNNPFDPRAVGWWRVQWILTFAVPIAVLVVLGLLIPGSRITLLVIAAVLLVLGIATSIAMPVWWYRFHRWEFTDTAVYVRTGYFWREWRVAPLSRIQTVDTLRGPLQQRFGLATVTVTTASSKGPVKMEGLDAEQASELAETLTRTTQATPGDAT